VIYWKAKKELFYQLLYLAVFSFIMIWVMLCLSVPILWVEYVKFEVKSFLVCLFLLIAAANFAYANRHIKKKWGQVGAEKFEKLFDSRKNMVDWDVVAMEMEIRPVLYVPGIPGKWSPGLSACLVASMLFALNYRSAYPEIAAVTGGIPSAIFASFFFQMRGYYFAQACKVSEIEKEKKVTIKCND
jgi:uncharacterized membrane-anchored protein YitT (DUF2179 family)